MKTIFTLLILSVLFTGCEKPKDYKCTCTTTKKGLLGGSSVSTSSTTIYAKQRQAQRQCDDRGSDGYDMFSSTTCFLTQK